MTITETAYAKINLALHVRRRRKDGYHELETLFAFVDQGDVLTASEAAQDSLSIHGEYSDILAFPSLEGGARGGGSTISAEELPSPPLPQGEGDDQDNLVAHALNAIPRPQGLAVTLEKNLPVAAGLGGGSADAGAVFRIVRALYGLPDDWHERAAKLGADVPACVESVTCIGRGTGTDLEAIDSDLTGTAVLLVNPRVPLATGPVFNAWDGQDRGPMPSGAVSEIAQQGRNDLEEPAIRLCPQVDDVLTSLSGTDAFLTRMSGSGATCFALYRSHDVMLEAAEKLVSRHPDWWQMRGRLR